MLKLILPVLFPSWRFFSSIGPSPRIEVGFAAELAGTPLEFLPAFPLPEKVSPLSSIVRLLHNPEWNERLYINTCAEHLFEAPSEFHEQQIAQRLLIAIQSGKIIAPESARHMVFRIRTYAIDEGQVQEDVIFISRSFVLLPSGDTE